MVSGKYDESRRVSEMTEFNIHIPVLLEEVLSYVSPDIPDMTVMDMTIGRAGHASNILYSFPNAFLYGFDCDQSAIDFSQRKLAEIAPDRFKLFHCKYSQAVETLKERGITGADFILFDTGVSSPQFDDPQRGFSYRFDAPLDMRMDKSQSLDARTVVNEYSESELSRIIYEYGGEKYARQIARQIVIHRKHQPINTTFELVDAIKAALPERVLRKPGHPAKQTFMAIREEVNNERDEMETSFKDAIRFLNHGGRCCIITFNSDDDALVKKIFLEFCPRHSSSRFLPPLPEEESEYRILTKKPIVPSRVEEEDNPRSEPAKLRVIERS